MHQRSWSFRHCCDNMDVLEPTLQPLQHESSGNNIQVGVGPVAKIKTNLLQPCALHRELKFADPVHPTHPPDSTTTLHHICTQYVVMSHSRLHSKNSTFCPLFFYHLPSKIQIGETRCTEPCTRCCIPVAQIHDIVAWKPQIWSRRKSNVRTNVGAGRKNLQLPLCPICPMEEKKIQKNPRTGNMVLCPQSRSMFQVKTDKTYNISFQRIRRHSYFREKENKCLTGAPLQVLGLQAFATVSFPVMSKGTSNSLLECDWLLEFHCCLEPRFKGVPMLESITVIQLSVWGSRHQQRICTGEVSLVLATMQTLD